MWIGHAEGALMSATGRIELWAHVTQVSYERHRGVRAYHMQSDGIDGSYSGKRRKRRLFGHFYHCAPIFGAVSRRPDSWCSRS